MATHAHPPSAHFGEEGARLTYGSYLRLPAARPAAARVRPPAHDELLFITIHQVYELWFQQMLHELETARDAMSGGQLWWAGTCWRGST